MAYTSEQGEVEVCYPVYDLESQQFIMNINGRLETMKALDQKIGFTDDSQDGHFEVVQPEHVEEESSNEQCKDGNPSVEMNDEENSMDINGVDNTESVIQVMLDDDQCLTLEQKGRVLLEQDSRFFLLDNVGLQEITKQNDFIKQLREEHLSLCKDKENDTEMLPEVLQTMHTIPGNEISQTGSTDPTTPPFVEIVDVEECSEHEPSDGDDNQYTDADMKDDASKSNQNYDKTIDLMDTESLGKQHETTVQDTNYEDDAIDKLENHEFSEEETINKTVISNHRSLEPIMTISMDYVVKELPPKLYIGQSHDGKKLYAKLRKIIPAPRKMSDTIQKLDRPKLPTKTYPSPKSKLEKIKTEIASRPAIQKCINATLNESKIDDSELEKSQTLKLMDEVMSSDPEDLSYLLAALWFTNFSTLAMDEHVDVIEKTVNNLMQLESVKKIIVGQNVIVTKVVKSENGGVNVPFVVTGFVSDVSEESGEENWRFMYIPELLTGNNQELISEYQMSLGNSKFKSCIRSSNKLLHIAIVESPTDSQRVTNYATNVLVVYKSLRKLAREFQKHTISHHTLRNFRRPTRRKVSSSHACAACGATFSTELELCKHQDIHKLEEKVKISPEMTEEDNTLKIVENSRIILNEQQFNKMYVCYYCKKVFTRCSNLQRHMSIHFDPVISPTGTEPTNMTDVQKCAETLGQSKGVFRCRMCSCSYFYASTLTRHIMTCHIDPIKPSKQPGQAREEFS